MLLSYRQKIVLSTVFVVFVLAVLLVLAEGSVRLRQWLTDGHAGKIVDLLEMQDGLRVLKPGANTRTITINSLGFRGPPLVQPKPDDALRIAFVGASTTFCAEVSRNAMTWPSLVTEAVKTEYPSVNIDYINAAAPGYTLKSSLLNFRRRVVPLEPDVAVIYHATNDLSWETRSLAMEQGIYAESVRTKKTWLMKNSQLWYLVVKNLNVKKAQKGALDQSGKLDFIPSDLGAGFRMYLKQLVNEAKEASSIVALVTFSHRIRREQTAEEQVAAAASALYYMPFMDPQGLLAAFTRYNQIIAEVAAETGAILIDGEDLVPADGEHFNDSVHFKDAGSRVMARRVADVLLGDTDFQVLIDSKQTGG